MALPSSPPSLPEDPPSSPPLLPSLPAFALDARPVRKRQHSDYASQSSDPLFSDDASDAEAKEDEAQPCRKRLVKGPWWALGNRAGRDLRRGMAKRDGYRNADSGVWMGSDDSNNSLTSRQSRMGHLVMCDQETEPVKGLDAAGDPESFAMKIVHGCLENGKEVIDLSELRLARLSNSTLRPLHQMIKQAHADLTRPPSEDEFTALTPSIQLYLSSNNLTSLPSELFRLENLTVLSLRNNELKELPPQLASLEKLQELNVAGNGLRFLPWELLGLLRAQEGVRKISLRPNPFLTVRQDEALSQRLVASLEHGRRCLINSREMASREQLVFLAASRTKFMDIDGGPVRASATVSAKSPAYWEEICLEPQQPPASPASLASPSLFELALRVTQKACNIHEAMNWCASGAPPAVLPALQEAAHGIEYGNKICSGCLKEFIIPRAEWLEYWFYGLPKDQLAEDKLLPFKRQACSWNCAQVTPVGTAFA